MTTPQAPDTAVQIFNRPDILEKFQAILKGGTSAYIQSALLCIADNPKLMECTPQSLIKSALRSATLGLSLDPALRQGFMIPRYDKKVKGQAASFQPHYNGLYQLAQRTGKYRAINVSPIYEGEQVFEDVRTGLHAYRHSNSSTFLAPSDQISGLDNGYRDVTSGKNSGKVIGYLGYFRTMDGLEKSVWMTVAEIHEHAQKWAPENYASEYGAWQDDKKRPIMEMKTVFIQLTKFMDLSGERNSLLRNALDETAEDEIITVESTPAPSAPQSDEKKMTDLVSPLSPWAVEYAATEWNISNPEARSQILGANFPATMTRGEFIEKITG